MPIIQAHIDIPVEDAVKYKFEQQLENRIREGLAAQLADKLMASNKLEIRKIESTSTNPFQKEEVRYAIEMYFTTNQREFT